MAAYTPTTYTTTVTAALLNHGETGIQTAQADADTANAALAAKAALASPTFTGTPAAPTAAAGTNTTQIATTAFVAAAVLATTITTKTTSYTLALADASTILEMDSASAQVFTIPPNATVAFPVGTTVELVRIGTGSVTITPGAAVSIPNAIDTAGTASRTITSRYTSASLYKRATNEWVLSGSLT